MRVPAGRGWGARGRRALALLTLALWVSSAAAEKADATISIGKSRTLWSQALQEQRRIFIHLPPRYETSGRRYPVLYLLDAETQFRHATSIVEFLSTFSGRMPEMIVVGIANTDRTRDLTPPTTDATFRRDEPRGGGAPAFMRFLVDELLPWVGSQYRTASFRVLTGHSFGGLFCSYALIHEPQAFRAYIAVSPSLWWDREAVVSRTEAGIRSLSDPPWLFVSWGDNEQNIRMSAGRLVAAFQERPMPGLVLEHRYYPGDDHMSTPHRSLYDALEHLFADWRLPIMAGGELRKLTLAEVEAHAEAASRRYGFPVTPSFAALANVAETLLEQGDRAGALAVSRRNAREHSDLAEAHFQLGELLERLGRKEEAVLSYESSVRLAVDDENPYGNAVERYREKARLLRPGRTPSGR
jgi:predicted alpha/beta superfamily hydrolase